MNLNALFSISLTSLVVLLSSCNETSSPAPKNEKPTGEVEAVVNKQPTVPQLHAYKVVHHANYLATTAAQAGGTNVLLHTRKLPTEGADPVVTPALDHLYSKAVIDLTEGPVFLGLPEVSDDRYFSIHVTDQEHYTIYDEIRPSGRYAFVRQGQSAELPEGVTAIDSPGDYPHLFIRTQVKTPEDLPNTLAIQEQIELEGMRKPLNFDNAVAFTLKTHDIYPQNAGILVQAKDYSAEDHQRMFEFTTKEGISRPNLDNIGMFGPIDSEEPGSNDPVIRALGIIGHLGLPADHAYYPGIVQNCNGEPLNGSKAEVFRFNYTPGVNEFWSITRYSLLTRNTLPGKIDMYNAYNTQPDEEGYITITFSAEDPQDGSYWMPVNAGEPYYFVPRYYKPDMAKLDNSYCPD
jgi:hypothetical protein